MEPRVYWRPQGSSFDPVTTHFIQARVYIHILSTIAFNDDLKLVLCFPPFILLWRFSNKFLYEFHLYSKSHATHTS
jgi:hypothetical protein